MTVANISGGFRVSGVYPLNRLALSPPTVESESLCQETGLLLFPCTALFRDVHTNQF